MSFFNYPDNVLPAGNEVLVDFSARITDEMTAKKFTGKEINNLPDSDFAYISPGGKKDSEGKTIPRSLRHLPIPDAAHVRNALARLNQTDIPPAAKATLPCLYHTPPPERSQELSLISPSRTAGHLSRLQGVRRRTRHLIHCTTLPSFTICHSRACLEP